MTAIQALDFPLGPLAGPTLVLLGLPPNAPRSSLGRLTEAFFLWAAGSAGLSSGEFPPVRQWFREFLIAERTSVNRSPGLVAAGLPLLVPTWATLQPQPAPNHTWVEVMAAGVPVSAAVVAYSLTLIFEESKAIDRYNRAVGHDPRKVFFSFRARAAASGCSFLVPAMDLDQSASAAGVRTWSEPPRKRLQMAQAGLAAGPAPEADRRLVRPPEALAREAGLRSMAASVMSSWQSYASGLRCWSVFMDSCFPADPHFPARVHHVSAFAPFFQNGDTLEKYLSHVHFGERLLLLDRGLTRDQEKAAVRGARKGRPRREGPAFRRATVLALVHAALSAGRVDLARLMVIARAWLLRVQSEGLGLQANGRAGLLPDSIAWHSVVTVVSPAPRPCVRITWRVRKNAPGGDSAERTCSCGPSPESRLLCGPCALLGQIAEVATSGSPPAAPLFPGLAGNAGLAAFRRVAAAVALRPAWHAFRRGMAQDMLAGGHPLGEILLAGGWRSGAFLRYLTRFDLDRRVALEHAMAESGDEG